MGINKKNCKRIPTYIALGREAYLYGNIDFGKVETHYHMYRRIMVIRNINNGDR